MTSMLNSNLSSVQDSANSVKTHIVIPARYQSARLPGKPLLLIHGKPMILWVAQKASEAHFADDLCIATDDKRIQDVCEQAGFDVVMTSPMHDSGTDRLAEVARKKGWGSSDIVVNMQGDEPLVPPILLEQVKDLLLARDDCVMATLYEPILSHDEFMRPSVVKVVTDNQQRALYFSRAPIPCDRDHALALAAQAQVSTSEDTSVGLVSKDLLSNERLKVSDDLNAIGPDDSSLDDSSLDAIGLDDSSDRNENCFDRKVLAVPQMAHRHLGLYAYRVQLLQDFVQWPLGILENLERLEQLRVMENGGRIAIDKARVQLPAGVDTLEDLQRLNRLPRTVFEA